MRGVKPLISALCIVMGGAASTAHASAFDVFGFGPRAQAMGGALTGGIDDYTAAYYNPASLTLTKNVNLGLGLTLTVPALYIDRNDPASKHENVLPGLHGGVNLGWRYPVGGIFKKKVAIGINLYLPVGRLLRIQGHDPSSPQFYLYQNLHDKLVIVAAIAYRPVPWLSFGIGLQALANLGGSSTLHLDVVDKTFDAASAEVDVPPSGGIVAGLQVSPARGLQLGLSFRSSTSVSFNLPVDVYLGQAISLKVGVAQTVLWSPHQVALGMTYRFAKVPLTLAMDLTLSLWSRAPDPSPHLSIDIAGKAVAGLGLDEALDVSTSSEPIVLGFVNTLTPRIGVEWAPLKWLQLRGGYFFRPTPAPRQTASYAYLDNNAHVLGIGAGFIFRDPFKMGVGPVKLNVAVQATILSRRTVLRTDPNDPIGGLSHGGALWTFSTSVEYRY